MACPGDSSLPALVFFLLPFPQCPWTLCDGHIKDVSLGILGPLVCKEIVFSNSFFVLKGTYYFSLVISKSSQKWNYFYSKTWLYITCFVTKLSILENCLKNTLQSWGNDKGKVDENLGKGYHVLQRWLNFLIL